MGFSIPVNASEQGLGYRLRVREPGTDCPDFVTSSLRPEVEKPNPYFISRHGSDIYLYTRPGHNGPEKVNVYDLLRHDHLVVSKEAVKALEARCLGSNGNLIDGRAEQKS
jgi:hypothetical protein